MIATLTGQNSFMLQAELRQHIDAFVQEHTDMGLERLDGEEVTYDRIRESLESLPFLASKKLVVLRTPGTQKQFAENAERLLEAVPESIDVVLIEPKLDKRSSYYKYLKKATQFKEYNELDAPQLVRWLTEQAKTAGGTLSQRDASTLISRVGINQQLLSRELEKLLLFDPVVTEESIMKLTEKAPQSTIFDLLDAALTGRTKQAIALYE
jgi:DNA polymerase-3 subunit delta